MENTELKYCLTEYFTSLQKQSFRSLRKIAKKFKSEEIHNFRIGVKKLNAFKIFIKFLSPEFSSDETLKKLYTIAGKLRGHELLKRELQSRNIYNKRIKKYLKVKIRKYKNNFIAEYSVLKKIYKDSALIGKQNVFSVINTEINLAEKLYGYLLSALNKIQNFKPETDEGKSSLHDLRKLMKELGYNYLLYTKCLNIRADKTLEDRINYYNKILGEWHDEISLKKFILKHKISKNPDRLAETLQYDINILEKSIFGNVEHLTKIQELFPKKNCN